MTPSVKLQGVGASAGAAVGPAFLIDRRKLPEPHRHIRDDEVDAEIARLNEAVHRSDQQLAEIRGKLSSQPAEHGLILEAHRLMLTDPALLGAAEELIKRDQVNAEWAVRRVVKQLRSAFDAIDDPYFRDRRNDVDFVGDRIVQNLLGEVRELEEEPPEDAIIVAHDLSPADTMVLLNGRRIAGIVTDEGGRTSHTAIVARALDIPAVVGLETATELIGKDDILAVDGASGLIVIHPSADDTAQFLAARRRHQEQEEEALATADLEARTPDGQRVSLRANIELVEEVPSIIAHGADGIGLYRTEFLFLNRRDLPNEDEHVATYRRLLESLPGRVVTVRTFDLGGEKSMGREQRHEANPALGLRAIRYCLAHPEMFLTQLRALWRASAYGELRVMFPLVTGLGEWRRARAMWRQAREEVIAAGHPVADDVALGIMVETPAAVALGDRLAQECAFFSVGTNDLIQYALAVDRGNPDVGYLHTPTHPAILRLLRQALDAGRAAGIPVSICGEMAGDPAYALLLLGMGAEELSMSGLAVPLVKQVVRRTSRAESRALAEHALGLDTADEVEAYLRTELLRRFPDLFGADAIRPDVSEQPHAEA